MKFSKYLKKPSKYLLFCSKNTLILNRLGQIFLAEVGVEEYLGHSMLAASAILDNCCFSNFSDGAYTHNHWTSLFQA